MAKGKVLQTIIDIGGVISPTLGKSLKVVTDKLEGVNIKALAVGAAIGGIAIGTAIAVGKAGVYLAELGDSYNSAVNDIAASTGLVGDELEAMGESIKEVYGSNFGESMEDVAAGLSEVYRNTGLIGEELEATTKGAYALSDTFGYEIAESSRAAKAMMENFGVSGEEAMGLIAAGAQNGLDYSGELIDSINEYSVQFAKLGFSADDMFTIFQQGADSGAWNLDKVGDAVKEFSIRSIDGSKTTVEAFSALGLNSDEMMATFAAGGEDASIAFQGVLSALMDMDDQVQRDAIGVSLFGTQWEDLGTEAMAAMSDIQGGAYDSADALGEINAVKYDNLGDAFQGIKRQAEVALLPMASAIANALTDIAPIVSSLFEQLGPVIEQVTADAMPFVQEFLGGILEFLPTILPLVLSLASTLLPMLSAFLSDLLPPLLVLIEQLIPPLLEVAQAILPVVSSLLLAILPILVRLLSAVLPVIADLLLRLLPILEPILDLAMALLEPIIMLVESLLPLLGPILTMVIESMRPWIEVLGGVFAALGPIIELIAKVVGWVAKGLTWAVDLIFGGDKKEIEDTATAQGYATGGFTDGLSIAGEDPRYPVEAVISFNPAYRSENLSYWARAGRMLGADVSDYSLDGNSGGGTTIDMGGVTFAPQITVTGHADKQSIMEAIEAEYPEFIDMLENWLFERGRLVYE